MLSKTIFKFAYDALDISPIMCILGLNLKRYVNGMDKFLI